MSIFLQHFKLLSLLPLRDMLMMLAGV